MDGGDDPQRARRDQRRWRDRPRLLLHRPQGENWGEGAPEAEPTNQVYNVAVGEQTTLNGLFEAIRSTLEPRFPHLKTFEPIYRGFRAGDVRHSLADIGKAQRLLGYQPSHRIGEGLREAMDWYVAGEQG
jgi:nucleoside-diphosphate-sugar epimerase